MTNKKTIANFSSPLFLWLKWRIDRAVYWILLAGLAICSLSNLLTAMPNYYEHIYRFKKHQRNITEMFHVSEIKYFNPSVLSNLLAVVPITVSLISFFLLILSLWRHTKHMKLNVTGWRDPSTEAHITAMKNVTFFLFLLSIYYAACLLVNYSDIMNAKLVSGLGKIVLILYPSGHSLILIIGNSRLKQAFVRILRSVGGLGGTAYLIKGHAAAFAATQFRVVPVPQSRVSGCSVSLELHLEKAYRLCFLRLASLKLLAQSGVRSSLRPMPLTRTSGFFFRHMYHS
nr:unnamed protein product [Sorex araneus]